MNTVGLGSRTCISEIFFHKSKCKVDFTLRIRHPLGHRFRDSARGSTAIQKCQSFLLLNPTSLDPGKRLRERSYLHSTQKVINKLQTYSAPESTDMQDFTTHALEHRGRSIQRVLLSANQKPELSRHSLGTTTRDRSFQDSQFSQLSLSSE